VKRLVFLLIMVVIGINSFAESNLKRGMNMGNALEAPEEGSWGITIEPEYFKAMKDAGFDYVRVPVRWDAHTSDKAPYKIDPVFMKRVKEVVDLAYKNNLKILINVHHFDSIMYEPDKYSEKLNSMWNQISTAFKDYDNNLYFEILNEPKENMSVGKLNILYEKVIKTIRKTSTERKIALGGIFWSNFASTATTFVPKDDKNIILLFNYYNPFEFTHQGASWVDGSGDWEGTTWIGTEEEKQRITKEFDFAVEQAKLKGVDLMIGEFGAYSDADMKSRATWTDFVAREAEKRGIAWTYWEFCSSFGAYDAFSKEWRKPLLEALIK